jgi:hypothetical protein
VPLVERELGLLDPTARFEASDESDRLGTSVGEHELIGAYIERICEHRCRSSVIGIPADRARRRPDDGGYVGGDRIEAGRQVDDLARVDAEPGGDRNRVTAMLPSGRQPIGRIRVQKSIPFLARMPAR